MKRKGKVGVGRLGDYCKPGRRQQELGCQKNQESGGVSCLMSFLKTWLENRRGKVVGIIPMGVLYLGL